ncbi:MAG TPA: penicillin-binding protein 1C [Hyphomicrobiaceae bacterium]|nr:penicillin-binding protein 1C [Hyphomicrobiaceae bacterium]
MSRPAQRVWRVLLLAAATAAAATASIAAAIGVAMWQMGPPPLANADRLSAIVLDRNGQLLRAFTTEEGRWRLPVEPAEVDPRYIAMLLAFEDRRFRSHFGIDPIAMGRAILQFVTHGRVISGGSTLTMQVARLLEGEHDRTLIGKFRQMVRALQLEARFSKDDILRLYLTLAPFGGNLEGVRAASLAYFGKEPRRLSIGEAALLVALPQSPEARRPDRAPAAARRARDRALARLVEAQVITASEADRAMQEAVPNVRSEFPKLAPHLSESRLKQAPNERIHRVTLDREMQASLEALARSHARALGERLSAAILAVDHHTGEVLAHVGSSDYFDEARLGAIDMTGAVRSPGSTLKPLIYGLAFEAGLAHPETLIEDRPVRFGSYAPKNFDEDFHGTVTLRHALQQSLNVPAVKLLHAVGPSRLVGHMRRIGLSPVIGGEGEPTLAIALGGIGLTLTDLAQLYAALARGGEAVSLMNGIAAATAPRGVDAGRTRLLLSPVAAWYVTDILKDSPPPESAFGGRIAYKTGTSYGYRDAWAVGYDGRYTVAVWVGRADGASTPGLSGRTAAAPLLFDAFQRLSPLRASLPRAPEGAIAATGAGLPPPLKRFDRPAEEAANGPFLDPPVAIAFPLDRSEVEVSGGEMPLVLRAEGGALPLTWMADGRPIAVEGDARQVLWQPDGRGFVRLSVIDAKGRTDRVTVRLR